MVVKFAHMCNTSALGCSACREPHPGSGGLEKILIRAYPRAALNPPKLSPVPSTGLSCFHMTETKGEPKKCIIQIGA